MDEGKPTKAKWWSRPRPNTGGTTEDGDWHLPAPHPPGPSSPGPESTGTPVAGGADASAPPAGDLAGAGRGAGPGYGLPPSVDSGADAGQVGAGGGAAPGHGSPSAPGTSADPTPGSAPMPPAQASPRPLHDPDPYSTPPYGEPGPWAPAPPVQHPAGTPPHGTASPFDAQHGAHPGTPGETLQQAPAQPYAAVPEQPHLGEAPSYPAPQDPAHQPAPDPYGTPGGPWQRYDPWAGPVGLSGSGGLVGERPRRSRRAVVTGAVLIAVVSGVVGGALGSYLERNGGTDVELPQAGAESTHRAPGSVAGIAAAALPGVVTIHTKGSSEEGTGTGFVLDGRGHILTNNHVVQPAGSGGRISVTFAGGESADAKVVGHDSGYDLAVIKVSNVRGLKPLPLGNSENVQVGDPVVAIGAPFDLANTVTSGIISAKDRPITAGGEKGDGTDVSYVDALQTDAPINPGNSGGPLVDSRARVIGINSAIRSADSSSDLDGGQSGSIGLGFAIPINQAKRVAEELINTGRATHPVIGVTLDMDYSGDGARVGTKGNDGGSAVSPGGPGARAGIRPGDVITEVDGVRVHTGEELIVKIRAHRPKDELALTVERGGTERKVSLVLGSADGD
ncbi:trypsin-like peptidase domain-containing protein [Streptomyces sp. NPDC046939]|uniref:trypsin-like peptidase domain-containing protein n=1 Tax=Streptomyces sp. NPDC046939 TaxID=3155376 RepID=UPI0033CC54AB